MGSSLWPRNDVYWMRYAIELANEAKAEGKRPFGCIIVHDSQQVPVGFGSGSETPTDPTCHSEIEAIKEACIRRRGLLQGCSIYSTHMPCPMCAGAITHAKLDRVVFGSARNELPELFRDKNHAIIQIYASASHQVEIVQCLRDECVALFDDEVAALDVTPRPH
jgi:tRNA(adenine34) deaminase